MSDDHAVTSPSAVVDAILGATAARNRRRRRRRRRRHFRPELVDAFCARASASLRSDPSHSRELGDLALLVAKELDDDPAAFRAHQVRAKGALLAGDFRAALRAIDAAAATAHARRTELDAARNETLRVQALTHLERYEEARESARRAEPVFTSHGDRNNTIRVLTYLADLAFRLDKPREALAHLGRAEQLLPASAPPRVRATIAANRATALEACNRFNAAMRQFQTAHALFTRAECEHTVAQVDYNTAYAEALRGRYEDALRRLVRAETVFRRLGDQRHLGHVDLDRAEIHLHLNLPEDAATHAAAAERSFHSVGLAKECAQAVHLAGRAAEVSGHLDRAASHYRRAEVDFRRLGLRERAFQCIVQQGCIAEREQRYEAAQALCDRAETLLDGRANPLLWASVRLLRARLDLASGAHDGAVERAGQVVRDCRRIHAPWVKMDAWRTAGRAHMRAGNPDRAIDAYTRAIDHLESYRGGVPPDEFMAAFLAGRARLYEEIVEVLVAAGQTDLAFEFTERGKSRALVDLLAGRKLPVARAAGSGPTVQRLEHLRQRLTAVYGRMFRSSQEGDARSTRIAFSARAQAARIEDELAKLLRDQRFMSSGSGSLLSVDAPDLVSVQRDLDADETLVEYLVTDEQLFTFVVTRDAAHVVRSDVGQARLRFLLERFHFHMAKHQHPFVASEDLVLRATRKNLDQLAQILLGPVVGKLRGRRLVIVPHGVLHHLPFHALPWGDDWLADRFEVVYAPSAAVYRACRKRTPRASGAPCVFGLPDAQAPQIEDETWRVAKALGTDRVFLGESATLERLRAEVAGARVVHIATHGMFRRARPMLSSIRLADAWVNLYDLYDLDVRGELVVLSTCESGTADVTDADEILGLTRGFLYAGAPALLTTQWQVSDSVTAEFMDSFYRHLGVRGDAASAHKKAMTDIRSRHPHPYFWAPFFLTGRPITSRCRGAVPVTAARWAGEPVPIGT